MKRWERYLLKESVKTCLLFLGCFYFLYAAIDYSTHMQDFLVDKKIHFSNLIQYYSFMWIKRADLLLPLALLISTIKLLTSLTAHGELIALQTAGLSLKKIARPFIWLAVSCSLFNYANTEFFLPSSLNFLDQFRAQHFKHARTGTRSEPIHTFYLEDGSKMICQTQDSQTKEWLDLFWIRSIDDLWRMKSLDMASSTGRYVDHIQRNEVGHFEKTESFDQYAFPAFRPQPNLSGKGSIPMENRKISALVGMWLDTTTSKIEKPQILTHLLFKCAMPLLPFFLIFAIFPYCTRYQRNATAFPLYALALFGFIAFCALMDSCVILGESQAISPWIAIGTPLLIVAIWLCGRKQKVFLCH